MTNEKLKLEEIEFSHTLGRSGEVPRGEGSGEGVDATQLSGTLIYNNFCRHDKPGWVAITDAPVCEEGGDFWRDLNPALTFFIFFLMFLLFLPCGYDICEAPREAGTGCDSPGSDDIGSRRPRPTGAARFC
jgi:hypothetical protein